jgi:hypothetical protein
MQVFLASESDRHVTVQIQASADLFPGKEFLTIWSEFLATDPEARVRFPALAEKKK